MDQPIIPQPGNARNPADFVGRRQVTETARRLLMSGSNLALTDPRRMGKTFWLTTFTSTTKDFRPVLIDYEGVATVQEFLMRTVDALRGGRMGAQARAFLQTVFDHLDVGLSAGPLSVKALHRATSPVTLLQDMLQAFDETSEALPVLIVMDEVPMAIQNITNKEGPESARELLQTLRHVRATTRHVRWLIAGSIGFHHVLRGAHATEGDLNDLENLHLGPLPNDEADELARRLLMGIGQTPTSPVVFALVAATGGVPYLLHKFASTLSRRGNGPCSAGDVEEVLEDFIDDPDESNSYAHLLTRIDHFYGTDTPLAEAILDALLERDHNWIPLEQLPADVVTDPRFRLVLDGLVSDHYLVMRGRSSRWRYPNLAYIWARRRRVWDRP